MPWSTDDIKRLIEVEARLQGVDPQLALAVATQESYLSPNATGDGGRARGLFQMQEAAAKDAGIDPARRHEVPLNVEGGVRFLKQKLDQSGGNVDQALSRYNRGTPDYRGIGDPNYVQNVLRFYPGREPQQQPGLLPRARNFLSPASADAAAPTYTTFLQKASTPPPATTNLAGRSRLEEIEAELARRAALPPAGATAAPAPPTTRSTPEQDAAYRQWAAQQGAGATTPPAPVSQMPPSPSAHPGASQGPPAPSPADEQYAAQTIAQMRQNQPRTVVTDPAALLAIGGGPATPQAAPAPVSDPAALLAVGGGGAPVPQTREQEILAEARARQHRGETQAVPQATAPGVPTVEQETLQEGFTKPSTMIPLLTGLGTARVALTPLSRLLVEPMTQTMGEVGGRWWETGKTPTPTEALETFAWNLVPSAAEDTLRAGGRAVLRRGAGGQIIARDAAARQAQGLGARVMQAPEREALSEMFDEIARSGVKLDVTPLRTYWGTLATTDRQRALQEVRRISSPLADVLERTGGTGLKGWDIGDLQHLRSELLKRRATVTTPETKDLLYDLRVAVDDAIEQGIAVGKVPAGFAPERLKDAQAGWRKMRQAEDLQGLVTKHTSFNPNTQYSDLNLAALNKELQGTTKRSQRLLASMDEGQRDALQAEIKDLSRNYPFVKIPSLAHIVTTGGSLTTAAIMALTGAGGPAVAAALPAALSLALGSPKAMGLFREAIVRDRGELKPNTIALILDTARRELGYGPQGAPASAAASGASR